MAANAKPSEKQLALRTPKSVVQKKKSSIGLITDAQLKEFTKYVDINRDFALIPQAGGKSVEPTRDLAMKLIAFFQMSFDTELIKIEEKVLKNARGSTQVEKTYIMKAVVTDRNGNSSSGHGMASTEQSHTEGREDHDAMARAETRAIKRAIEGRTGLPLINQLIVHYFGGFRLGPNQLKELGLY